MTPRIVTARGLAWGPGRVSIALTTHGEASGGCLHVLRTSDGVAVVVEMARDGRAAVALRMTRAGAAYLSEQLREAQR